MELNLDIFNKLLLETIGVGLIIASDPELEFLFHNQKVLDWFPAFATEGDTLIGEIAGVDKQKLLASLDEKGGFKAAIDVKIKRRVRALSVSVTRASFGEESYVIFELQDNTKVQELEAMITSYSTMVEQQNRSLKREKERAEKLLLNIMPESVYRELKTFGVTMPQRYDEASILMLDFIGFSKMSLKYDPSTIISELNDIFTAFDRISEQQGCERLKTIGDAYVAVAGLPEPATDHAESISRLALMCVRYLKRRNETHNIKWNCRIGLAPGPVIGSVVGIQKYVYDIFGLGINLAARLEALSGPMDILLSEEMYDRIRSSFQAEEIGEMDVRGFGTKRIYRLLGADLIDYDIAAGMPLHS